MNIPCPNCGELIPYVPGSHEGCEHCMSVVKLPTPDKLTESQWHGWAAENGEPFSVEDVQRELRDGTQEITASLSEGAFDLLSFLLVAALLGCGISFFAGIVAMDSAGPGLGVLFIAGSLIFGMPCIFALSSIAIVRFAVRMIALNAVESRLLRKRLERFQSARPDLQKPSKPLR